MLVYIGADHRGFQLKERLKVLLAGKGYEIVDLGNVLENPSDDYPDFASEVGRKITLNPDARGILICGSGTGMCVTVNKYKNVRATIGISPDHVYAARHDDDINALCIASDFTEGAIAEKMAEVFLLTPFGTDERFARRLKKITAVENEWHGSFS
jgi:ribose 5-phosphate isomerase B